jgi:ubiquinone/menaquinone biosynthesis C-methylase UbiE
MSPPGQVDYDRTAGSYAAHRRVHPGIVDALCEGGDPGPQARILEVGCGTGNYVSSLTACFRCAACGSDPSAGMLARTRTHPEPVTWVLGGAEQIPFAARTFDLVFSVDVIHHVSDKPGFYREAARVLRPGGRVCTATDSADMIRQREILSGYFPETVAPELARYPRLAQLEAWMAAAGFVSIEISKVEAPYEITDAQPFRDRTFSSLHLIPESAWSAGLARLEHDLAHGPLRGVSRYACVWGRTPQAVRT